MGLGGKILNTDSEFSGAYYKPGQKRIGSVFHREIENNHTRTHTHTHTGVKGHLASWMALPTQWP